MSNPDSYVREITSIASEIKRINQHVKKLREQKKIAENYLYTYMERNNIEKYGNITIKSIRPRKRILRKPESQKKQDAITLFIETGIPYPEEFWEKFKYTQKYIPSEI